MSIAWREGKYPTLLVSRLLGYAYCAVKTGPFLWSLEWSWRSGIPADFSVEVVE